jgi:putative ABC transport system substrate-binding protein
MAKRMEFLRELAPHADVFATLTNPKNPNAAISTKEAQDAARALGKEIDVVHASSESEIDQAFAMMTQRKVGALLIAPDGLFIFRAAQIAALTTRYAIPASHERRAFPNAGGLISYGASQADGMHLAGVFVGRVLKGENPSNMPVMQPTKFELVINLKTAKALGLTVPDKLLVAADEVIE